MSIRTRLAALAALFLACLSASGQTPRVFLKFDGDRTDSSGAGIVTAVTPNSGFTPVYAADRFGVASKAVVFAGSQSLQIVSGAVNSNEVLGLRNVGGTNTSFTLAAWVYFTSLGSGQGYSTVFGNLGSGAGTLHAGSGSGNANAHFGFDGNDANGITTSMVTGQWFHLAFVYNAATQEQRIYINGMPENVRTGVTDTLKAADLYLGNWGTNNSSTNDIKGRLDDVLVYNAALDAGQVQALFNNVSPLTLPAAGTYSAPKLPGVLGFTGTWGVREMKANPNTTNSINGISSGTLVNADRIVRGYTAGQATTTVAEYQAPVINFRDSSSGSSHYFANDSEFGTNTAVDDNYLVLIAKCAVRIAVEDDYTFGFRGDDGSRLRVLGRQFVSSTQLAAGNNINPSHHGDGIYFIQGTGDSNTLGVVHLTPGDFNLELTYWEGSGGSSVEVFAARGAKAAVDGSFQLVGDTANGGLEIVRDPDTVPSIQTFTVNGGSTLFIHGAVPANFTLAWLTNAVPTVLSIDQAVGAVAIPSGTKNVAAPASTRTYTLTAQNGADIATKSVTVYVNSAPVISSFIADRTAVGTGQPVTLSWVTDGAVTLTLNPGSINVTGTTSRVVNPVANTTYTLTATNPSGSTPQSMAIQVGTAPTINSFTVTDVNPLFGAETLLAWAVSDATTLSIDQGIGTVASSGTAPVLPVQTTTYTLTAANLYGTATATVTVNQPTPIGVASPGFTCRRVSSSVAFPYAPVGYLDSALTLLGEAAGGAHFSSETTANSATVNFTDGNDGDFTSGNSAFPGGTGDNFAMRVSATLIVNTPGEYTFVVNSDDGARLRIDGVDVIVDDGTHGPSASSGRITLDKPTAQLEMVYYDTTGGAEVELGWIRPNLSWQLLTTIAAAAPIVRGQVVISEFMAENTNTLLDEDGLSSDWIEIWNSTNATVNLAGCYLTDAVALPNKWALPAWTLGPNQDAVVFASLKDRRPAQAVAGQDNSGTLAQPHLHTSFKLPKTGGFLALTQDNGSGGYNVLTVFNPFPAQNQDVSYGATDTEAYLGFMETPTPGQPNAASVLGFVADTKFVDGGDGITPRVRGRYTAAFNLTITSSTPGAIIRYTTDGSTPSRTNGTIYTAPIPIAATKVVRAMAYKPGWKATNVDTQTYLFIDDVVSQTAGTATALGFPLGPIAPRSQVLRYGMTLGNVTAGGGTLQDLKNALAAAPTVCMTTDVPNLMNATTGIYANADKHGLFWERPVSIEYVNATGGSEFQIDCGARIRGGYSRSQGNPKHAFHLFFRGSLYDGNLNYRLFGVSGASSFSQIDMRCEENYSWSFDGNAQNSLMREEWTRLTQGDTGQPYGRHGHFHLYINGIYWGIYGWEERTEAAYGETYLGGVKDDIDTVKSAGSSGGYNTEMTDGNFAAWENLYKQAIALKNDAGTESSRTARYQQMRGLNPDGARNLAFPVLLDADNLIDYLLIIFYDGSFDSPMSTFLANASNNWFGVRDRLGARGFTFYVHDNEHGMESVSDGRAYNRTGPWGGFGLNGWGQVQYNSRESQVNTFYSKSNPQYLHELLAYSAEYRQRFADRVQRQFFNGGALTTASATGRLNKLIAEVDPIIHAEAARWGSGSLNKNSWTGAKNTITGYVNTGGTAQSGFTNFGAQTDGRNSLIIQQLQGYQDPLFTAKPLFPTLAAPAFSGQFGGAVGNPYPFTITNPNGATGVLYYSVNGADPRDIGGGINAGALTGASGLTAILTSTATVRARVYNSATQQWSALTEAQYLVGVLASAGSVAISKIHYNPGGAGNLTQFIEVMNIGSQMIDLTNVHFTLGIQFTFAANTLLAPGARLVIARDQTAFATAYPGVPTVGVFDNGTALDTNGERLQLLDAAGGVIRDFSYNNKDPWPESPDNGGPSLVLLRPTTNPDHSLGANWRASYAIGGAPGSGDALSYNTWAGTNGIGDLIGTGDNDGDGYFNLVEYALGMNPTQPSNAAKPVVATQALSVLGVVSNYLTITITRPIGRDDVSYAAEGSTNLSTAWTPAILIAPPTFNGNGTETLTWRHANPKAANVQQFLHLRITRLP